MTRKTLFIGLSDNRVLRAEKDMQQNLGAVQNLEVGYNQAPAQVFFKSVPQPPDAYQQVYATLKYPFFVLVPDVLFDAANAVQYLGGDIPAGHKLVYDKIARNGVICIYTIDESMYNDLVHMYPNVMLRHFASVLIDYTVKTGFTEQQTIAAIDFENDLFYLCLSRKTDLLLCNKFAFKAPEDVLYFLLYSLEQFGISPAQCQLHVSGMVNENAEAMVLLKEYMEQVMLEETSLQLSDNFRHQTVFLHQDACV